MNEVRVLRSLAEIDCGEVDGTPIDEVRQWRPDYWLRNEAQDDDSFCWPGGETYRQFRKRVVRAVRTIAGRHAGRHVLVVTHAGVINQILGSMCNQRAARWENFRPGNTGVTEVLWNGSGGEVIRFDDREHLS